jgi:hypothetical protein
MMGLMDGDVDSLGKREVRKKEKRIQRRFRREETPWNEREWEIRYWNQQYSKGVEQNRQSFRLRRREM